VIANIIDQRKRPFRSKQITAIIEPPNHDNAVDHSDEAVIPEPDFAPYVAREDISVADAVAWATALPYAVTLFLYDLGGAREDMTPQFLLERLNSPLVKKSSLDPLDGR
jgi:hypothetical protein